MKKLLLLVVITVIIILFYSLKGEKADIPESSAPGPQGSPRLTELLGAEVLAGYAKALEPMPFQFPRDHGPHTDFRNEWWYLTGNLDSEDDRRFGFELTLFRFSVAAHVPSDESVWRSNQVYIGHFAITDPSNQKFYVAEKYSRGGLGLAGAQVAPFRVWLDDWELFEITDSAQYRGSRWQLRANDKQIGLDLTLTAERLPVLNGDDGLSQKSAMPGNASYYYSIPRLQTDGRLRIGADSYAVSGLAWLDREWGSGGLSKQQQGWDWFALQLSDGSDLMFYNLRRTDGEPDEHSAGTFVSANGVAIPLSQDDVSIEVLDYWDSPHGGHYPMAWRLTITSLDLTVEVTPVMRGQELTALVRYWEGAVDVVGETKGNKKISGRGYVELTGYADTLTSNETVD
jgi:predicted secreted hydrolase